VVAAQHKSEINVSGRGKGRRELGRGGDGTSLGFFFHPLIAIDADDETALGVAGAAHEGGGTPQPRSTPTAHA
jgi:hypothetical protein